MDGAECGLEMRAAVLNEAMAETGRLRLRLRDVLSFAPDEGHVQRQAHGREVVVHLPVMRLWARIRGEWNGNGA
jgi:hypothetical protein